MFKTLTPLSALLALGAAFAFTTPAAADAAAGKKVFRLCMACHAMDGKHRVGPDLTDIVGRPVASMDGFRYSKAMVAFGEDGKVWDEELLAEYLKAPRTVVKGTTMVFAGIRKDEDLANLIEFLKDPSAAE